MAKLPILRVKDADGNVFNIPAIIGPEGKSAYEVAVKNGFEGTEEEWLETLKLGPAGEDGTDGKSAYQYATDGGYTDTEENFYKDLAGMQGLMEWIESY